MFGMFLKNGSDLLVIVKYCVNLKKIVVFIVLSGFYLLKIIVVRVI